MGEAGYKANRYSRAVVIVFGILGNILVVISILRQKNLLKNNYYFLVLHLAICDMGALIIHLVEQIFWSWLEEPLVYFNKFYLLGIFVSYIFRVAGVGMMLIISVLRYRATVHPLKPAITRRKLKLVCGLVYVVGLIAGYGAAVPKCFMQRNDVIAIVYFKLHMGFVVSCYFLFPTIFMAVIYYKICRALIKQDKYIKNVCSTPVRRSTPGSSFNIMKHIRNRRFFFVCVITVLLYAVGYIPITVYHIWKIAEEHGLMMKYFWIVNMAEVVRFAGSHSVNPLIYGILDKKLFQFWKICRKKNK